MNKEQLKTQQSAFRAHESAQQALSGLQQTFDKNEHSLSVAIKQTFAEHGLDARFDLWGKYVEVPPSSRRVDIRPHSTLSFDKDQLRSTHWCYSDSRNRPVPLQTPICLPVEVRAHDSARASSGIESAVRWLGTSDNARIATMALELFMGHTVPTELSFESTRACFVASAVFGETSTEVSVLRTWRDERLSESILGQAVVKVYYQLSPFCAAVVQGNAVVRCLVRAVLLVACHHLGRSHLKRPNTE